MTPLIEFANKESPYRRWFHSDYFDLYVWTHNDGAPYSFQLCYSTGSREHCLTWSGASYTHAGVRDEGWCNATPILTSDGHFDANDVRSRFQVCSTRIEPRIRDFVLYHIDDAGVVLPS